MKMIKTLPMLIKKTLCVHAPEVNNRLVVNKQTNATEHHTYIADDIASYPASCTYSDGTIENYLNTKCDYDYLRVIHVTTQINIMQFASIINYSINASSLPIPEPTIFTGNPSWKCSFEILIETKSMHAYYLKNYLEAKTVVECTFFVNSNQHTAFLDAKEMLEKRYENPFLISIRDRLYKWSKIGPKDSQRLR